MQADLAPTAAIQLRKVRATDPEPVSDSDASRGTAQNEQVGQRIDVLGRVQPPFHTDRRAFPAMLIQNAQSLECLPVIYPVVHEVIRPDMTAILGPHKDTCTAVQPEPSLFTPLLRGLQPVPSQYPFHTPVVDLPAWNSQHSRDPTITRAVELTGQLDHGS
jgi:hypothetical protein